MNTLAGMDRMTLRPATLSLHTPLWVKALPLVFVVLVAYVLITGRYEPAACADPLSSAQCAQDLPSIDVSTPARPH